MIATGSGPGGGASGSATIQGTVYESNGQTVDRSGIPVTIVETGDATFTRSDGSFSFHGLEPGRYTLDFGGVAEGFDDESEDALGRPYVDIVHDGDTVEMRFAILNGVAHEFTMSGGKRDSTKVQLDPEGGFEAIGAELKVENEGSNDFEFEIEVEPIQLTDVVEIFIDDKTGNGFVSVGLAINEFEDDGDHEAEYERETEKGQALPLGALTLEDMVGWCVRVEINGVLAFTGIVPEAPTGTDDGGDGGDGQGEMEGKADLTTFIPGIHEAEVEIEKWGSQGVQEFEMEIEGTGIAVGDRLAFEIEDDSGTWVLIKLVIAEPDDDGAEAEVDTDHGDPFPLDVTDVADLVGRKVRIRRDETNDQTVIAEGTVPALVQT